MKRIEQILSREIGLMAGSIGSSAIEAAVRGRMASCQLDTVDEYAEFFAQSSVERSALVEDVVVSETWFFRDEDVFRDLAAFATGSWRRAHPEGILRVLSVPCATGEEPYSAAITLLEAGLPVTRFVVMGVDVSLRALDRARAAVYGKHAFRAVESPQRARYFETVAAGRELTSVARSAVTLIQGNVLDPFLVDASVRFDVIFCRNLLIYLDGPARARALDNLWQWLAPGGIFFGGHAESIEGMDPRFQRVQDAGFCAYARRPSAPRVDSSGSGAASGQNARAAPAPGVVLPQPVKAKWVKAPPARPVRLGGEATASRPMAMSPESPVRPPPGSLASSLDRVTDLANRGDNDAAVACERHISERGPSAEAYCLLGVIRTAAGAVQEAVEAFNRALYLEPTHYASLIHLALLHERRGDRAAASNLLRRAERVQQMTVTK